MKPAGLDNLDARVRSALTELRDTIVQRYPGTSFEVSPAADDPDSIHLVAAVDIEDTEEVLDLVIDRVVELQVEEGVAVHVILIRVPDRVLASMQADLPAGGRRFGA